MIRSAPLACFGRTRFTLGAIALGLLLSLAGIIVPQAAHGVGIADGKAGHCREIMDGQIKICAREIERFPNGANRWIRIHLDESYIGAPPHNEYFLWKNCGDTEYRILSRQPIHLPAVKRLRTVEATGESELHRTLRFFGSLACDASI